MNVFKYNEEYFNIFHASFKQGKFLSSSVSRQLILGEHYIILFSQEMYLIIMIYARKEVHLILAFFFHYS